jgi:ferritin-like metal-binding protein YciE
MAMIKTKPVENLLYEALETELGGIEIYRAAIECAQNDDLKSEWEEYLEQTERHRDIMHEIFDALGLDPDAETPGRDVVRHIGESLVGAIEMARKAGDPAAAQLVAAECVVLAETKDHLNWELIGHVFEKATGNMRTVLKKAHSEVEDEEDEHLYHTSGWARELWIEHLGMPAVLPPPEEGKDVKTAIGAARAKQARDEML